MNLTEIFFFLGGYWRDQSPFKILLNTCTIWEGFGKALLPLTGASTQIKHLVILRVNLFSIILWAFWAGSFFFYFFWIRVRLQILKSFLLGPKAVMQSGRCPLWMRPLEGAWSWFHHYQFLTKSSLLHDQPITNDHWGLCWLITWPWG